MHTLQHASNALPRRTKSHPLQTLERLYFTQAFINSLSIARSGNKHRKKPVSNCSSTVESTAAVHKFIDLALKRDFEALLDYVPDAAVERALQRKTIFR
jgi:hypothetical protein